MRRPPGRTRLATVDRTRATPRHARPTGPTGPPPIPVAGGIGRPRPARSPCAAGIGRGGDRSTGAPKEPQRVSSMAGAVSRGTACATAVSAPHTPARRTQRSTPRRYATAAGRAVSATLAAALFGIASGDLPAPLPVPPVSAPAVSAPAGAPASASSLLGQPEARLTAAITFAYRPHPPVILPPLPPPPPPPSVGETALAAARTALGTPYAWGGTGRGGFDCSGLVQWAFRQAGVTLPRTSQTQSTVGQPVSRADLRPGDLVFFYSQVSHVGIYVGDGQVLHAPQTGEVVKISPLARMPFHNARRV